ncbi:unnamed protein product [Dibothriocephalus latus]|uniref:Uncharacterized protein n=1 Tax=Dibothriocephalus latus TaxID=60516 RepID=A0A3P7L8N2_DIBLA|nr:unnamed protein product [Dibothriocephalus latus]
MSTGFETHGTAHRDLKHTETNICGPRAENGAMKNSVAAQCLKEELDKKCGGIWHVVVGEGFGFEVDYELKSLLYMYFGGNVGILAWKC